MAYTTIQLSEPAANLVLCTFDRPEVRNALNETMVGELREMMNDLAGRPRPPVLIFSGNEKVFVSGADIAELLARRKQDALRRINNGLFKDIEEFPGVTIAAIRGFALGGGCELAAACDFRVIGKSAKIGQPEVSLGIMPGAGATYRLPKLIGLANAKDLILTGRIITADEANRMGLASRLVDDPDVIKTSIELASQIAQNGHLAVQFSKLALNQSGELNTSSGMLLESSIQAVLFEDDEKTQRMQDFLDRKKK